MAWQPLPALERSVPQAASWACQIRWPRPVQALKKKSIITGPNTKMGVVFKTKPLCNPIII